jgi:hypothetical protein
LISEFEKKDMNDDFTAFVEKMYNDIPAKDDPLRAEVTVETLKRLWRLNLWNSDEYDDSDEDAPERIRDLIWANEPSAWMIASDILEIWGRKYDL